MSAAATATLPDSLPPPEVKRILFIRNLPYSITTSELFHLFGSKQFGPVRQIRLGDTEKTKGTAFVVYHTIFAAQRAYQKLRGFNCGGRYLIVNYYSKEKEDKKQLKEQQEEEIRLLKDKLRDLQENE